MNIRKIRYDDYADVDTLMRYLHKLHVVARPDLYIDMEHPYSQEEFEDLVRNPNVISLLGEEDKNVVGICVLHIKSKSGMIEKKTAYVDALVINALYQKKGYGRTLFIEAEKRAKKLGAERVDLMVWAFNENARNFYELLGMKPQRYIYEKEI